MPRTSEHRTLPRIVVKDVRKEFKLRHTHSIKETALAAVRRKPLTTQFRALDGVSFEIGEGVTGLHRVRVVREQPLGDELVEHRVVALERHVHVEVGPQPGDPVGGEEALAAAGLPAGLDGVGGMPGRHCLHPGGEHLELTSTVLTRLAQPFHQRLLGEGERIAGGQRGQQAAAMLSERASPLTNAS